MKLFKTLLTILFISLLSSASWSATIDDLVEREEIYYKKFSEIPFTGKLTGRSQGSIYNGVKEGDWIVYQGNGQLSYKGNYRNGVKEGDWIVYYGNGQLMYKGNLKNGKKEGVFVEYHKNGQLKRKCNYKNGNLDGAVVWYRSDGSVFRSMTGTFKDGVRISD